MCGILGAATYRSTPLGLTAVALRAARDTMTHRGPDDAGLWFYRNRPEKAHAALAHRRLAVLDPTPAGHQPMVSRDGRWVLAYNGELYNDAILRQELRLTGRRFATQCDTETVLAAIERWGPGACAKFRGMFAFAAIDTVDHKLILARDPLGVKPLYVARQAHASGRGPVVAFASEARAILSLPGFDARPDPVTLGAYLSSIRPTLGSRTLFAGVETLEPGEVRVIDLAHATLPERSTSLWDEPDADTGEPDDGAVRDAIGRSVRAHLRSDVPVCVLLSGGLDSAIVSRIAAGELDPMMTFCAGAQDSPDLPEARAFAGVLGSDHREAILTREQFTERWGWMVRETGMPLSTPNEVAIYTIARTLRNAGNTVTLSGEGADELFAGYDVPMRLASEFAGTGDPDAGRFHVESNQWTPVSTLGAVMVPGYLDADRCADLVLATYRDAWDRARAGTPGADPLRAHRRMHRMTNLPNLLRRLDSATMLASVEGRTPFADSTVARLAERMPTGALFDPAIDAAERPATKLALRRAFAGDVSQSILARPKASFPIPFESWIADASAMLRTSAFARETFSPAAVEAVAARPRELWNLAWPMMNLAMWGDHWWGSGSAAPAPGDLAASGASSADPKLST